MSHLYQDSKIICDSEGISIRWYYFPFGTKRIPYTRLRSITQLEIGPWTGQWRIWGTGNPRYWLNLDSNRPNKTVALIFDIGKWVRPVLTPEDAPAFLRVLEEKTGLTPQNMK